MDPVIARHSLSTLYVLFNRVAVLAVGVGIAPILPHLLEHPRGMRVVRACGNHDATFGLPQRRRWCATPSWGGGWI